VAYELERAVAYELVEQFGGPCLIRRAARGTYTPSTDTFATPAGETTSGGVAVKVPPGTIEWRAPVSVEDRESSDFIIPALTLNFQPEPGDVLDFASEAWDIVAAQPLDPDGTPIFFTVKGAK